MFPNRVADIFISKFPNEVSESRIIAISYGLLIKSILGTDAKLRKVTTSIVMCVYPSVRMLGPHWTDFHNV